MTAPDAPDGRWKHDAIAVRRQKYPQARRVAQGEGGLSNAEYG